MEELGGRDRPFVPRTQIAAQKDDDILNELAEKVRVWPDANVQVKSF